MNTTILTLYLTSIILLIATPGPVVALVLRTAATAGFRRAFLTIVGTNAASLVLIGTAAMIISGMLVVADSAMIWVSLAGCLFIGWLAITGLWQEPGPTDPPEQPQAVATGPAALQGVLIGLSNPKDIIFFVAFFPQFITITDRFQTSLIALTLLWVTCDFVILTGYALAARASIFQRHRRAVAVISSGFLLAVAIAGFTLGLAELIGFRAG